MMIQAYLDGEAVPPDMEKHLQKCPACKKAYQELRELVVTADKLKSDAELPEGFYNRLVSKPIHKPFPAALVAAVMFLFAFLSTQVLYPGYFEWWLTAGITHQVGLAIDFIMGIFYTAQTLGYLGLVMITLALVALEVLILIKFKILEGY